MQLLIDLALVTLKNIAGSKTSDQIQVSENCPVMRTQLAPLDPDIQITVQQIMPDLRPYASAINRISASGSPVALKFPTEKVSAVSWTSRNIT